VRKLFILFLTFTILVGSTGCSKKNNASSTDTDSSDRASNDETLSYESNDNQLEGSDGDSSKATNSEVSSVKSSKSVSSPLTPATTIAPTITPIPTIKVVIPEGFSAAQIGDRLQANGVCSKKDFLETINSYDFTYYSLVSKIPANTNRCFKLEGYLFPETYIFYLNMKPQDVIGKMLRVSEDRIGSKYSYTGMSTDDIIILASIIQLEAASLSDMQMVSAVFHNRRAKGMRLEADPTINYVERYLVPNISGDTDRYDKFYNTYRCLDLPAGAICNPGANALKAAVSPTAGITYLYFVTNINTGIFYYANTWEDHVANCATVGVTPHESVG